MLARLGTIDGVERVEVDHRGELLRIRATDAALEASRRVVAELGYEVGPAGDADPGARWYGASTVGELSREEAKVITDRVLPGFVASHHLTREQADRLVVVVTDELYACFRAHTLGAGAPPGSLRGVCTEAVATAAAAIVGGDRARDLAALVDADLSRAQDGATGS